MKKKKNLIEDIEKKISTWNERSSFTLGKTKGLSRSDLDVLRLYADIISSYGTYEGQLMKPVSKVASVLKEYGYIGGEI